MTRTLHPEIPLRFPTLINPASNILLLLYMPGFKPQEANAEYDP